MDLVPIKKRTKLIHDNIGSINNPFDILPNELLSNIFEHIPYETKNWFNVSLVCKRFMIVSYHIFNPSINQNEPLVTACKKGKLGRVKQLMTDDRIDPSYYTNDALFYAIHNGYLDVSIEILKDDRVDPSMHSLNPFACIPATHNRIEITKRLLNDPRLDPSNMKNIALEWSCKNGLYDITRELLKHDRIKYTVDPIYYLLAYELPMDIRHMFVECHIIQAYESLNDDDYVWMNL